MYLILKISTNFLGSSGAFMNYGNIIEQYFKSGFEQVKNEFPIVQENLITTPGIDLEALQLQFTHFNLPICPQDFNDYYQKLHQYVFPYVVNTASSRFIGHMTSVLPDFIHKINKLIILLNQNVVKIETSKALTFLEREALAMLHSSFYNFNEHFYNRHLQNPTSSLGAVVSSGTLSNLMALYVARNNAFPENGSFKGISEEGLIEALQHYGYKNSVIMISPLLHYSFEKAASLLGIGIKNIKLIPLTEQYTIDCNALRKKIIEYKNAKIHIMAIVGIAGATETGTIDPLEKIAALAEEFDIYFHVDAAFGGPLIFSDTYRDKLKGIDYADSISVCGHKQLYLPMGISLCLFKDPKKMNSINTIADYQANAESYDFGKSSLEGSRSALSLLLHASLHLLGKTGYEQIINIGMRNTFFLKNCLLENDAFELLLDPVINIINYRYIPKKLRTKAKNGFLTKEENKYIDQVNALLQGQQFIQGKTFVSKTYIPSHKYDTEVLTLRCVLANPLTTIEDIDEVLNDQLKIASIHIEDKKIHKKQLEDIELI